MNRERHPIPIEFYQKTALELAPSLLGCLLVKETDEGIASGYIVETEAYMGAEDRAAHSFNNRRTKRTEIMFGEAGRVYTYVMHTHTLMNVVAATTDIPQAVLIRAIEPYEGQFLMEQRRSGRRPREWTNGPGKLTKAIGVTMNDYGRLITEQPLYIEKGYTPEEISTGPRIGIENSGEARDYPCRFWVTGNRYVSR
ncbi:DNA-3-methyladenine glycosylase [Bacillus atrophaeus]|uniref:DNA-3-methyladenine glycosylase n=1 Tax=Bacillus atrophaeus TaxID=1452 RepID=UPI002282B61C|nr:DNA-3-methyladenine glycosylase [Bacillus atrophaeus]MCY7945427.1 DNA-3-methyladenine glycosylase [Bacillus atrophaeus]MCY8096174.1 DNA-3-methyladenine glycosylase [Bacillus atrophaeus]MCY9168967.1 DNA-3-methyladenine glycosylase [Bacillus atrophaeus]MEC0739816.1 DNA-3-methyladenine glycosylase [Bacillus atrophaeus]MEC0746518.1 DNA-3-methyladenine glycosylase [Bacillus atrophaeus]